MNPSPSLRILVITSRPLVQRDLARRNGALVPVYQAIPLTPVGQVRHALERALRDTGAPVTVYYLPHATPLAVQRALLAPYDVVHFVGHGDEDGNLLLEQDNAVADALSSARAAQMLRGSQAHLVLLSACYSGHVAAALQTAGLANVVAVDEQWPIADRAAALFNALFYGALGRGATLSAAFAAGVEAVQVDNEVGDHRPPEDPETGAALPPWSSRFHAWLGHDVPLLLQAGPAAYVELPSPGGPTLLPHPLEIIGRAGLMTQVIQALAGARLVTLSGPGGIGKTTVGLAVAHWQAERARWAHGVRLVALEGVRDSAGLASTLAEALGVTPDPINPWGPVRTGLARQDILLLLDNAEDLLDAPASAVEASIGALRQLLEGAPTLHLLVTSREALGLRPWEHVIEVQTMARPEALRLFLRYAPAAQQVGLALAHAAELHAICDTLQDYPLALTLAAPQLGEAGMTPARLLADLRQHMLATLDDVRSRGLPARLRSVRASLGLSYQRLSGRARVVFFALSVLPAGASTEVLSRLLGQRYEPAARELVARHLAQWQDERYTQLAPIRAYALATRSPQRVAAMQHRAARLYAPVADAMDDLLRPVSRRHRATALAAAPSAPGLEGLERALTHQALAFFDAERSNLLAAVDWAFAAQAWGVVGTLVASLTIYLQLRARWSDMVTVGHTAVAAAQQAGTPAAAGVALNNLGLVYAAQGRWAEALAAYEASLALKRGLGDRHGEGRTLNNLGLVYAAQGRWAEALAAYETALAICRELGDRYGEGQTLNNLGGLHAAQGDLDAALEACQHSLGIFSEFGDAVSSITVLRRLGGLHLRRGECEAGSTYVARALALALSLQARLVDQTLDQVVTFIKDTRPQHLDVVGQLGQGLMAALTPSRVPEGADQALREAAALAAQVCTLLTLLGRWGVGVARERQAVRAQAIALAAQIDAVTDGRWGLAAWVGGVCP